MTKKELMAHGGAAFPSNQELSVIDDDGYPVTVRFSGMELRDWFAGHVVMHSPFNKHELEHQAHWAYKMADALLEARKK